jgi:uncharacterized membrane protein
MWEHYVLSAYKVYSHLNNVIISICVISGMCVHMPCMQIKTKGNKGTCASYNLLIIFILISLPD